MKRGLPSSDNRRRVGHQDQSTIDLAACFLEPYLVAGLVLFALMHCVFVAAHHEVGADGAEPCNRRQKWR